MSEYPEHERMAAIATDSQTIGEFLEWLEDSGLVLCEAGSSRLMPWEPNRDGITVLLARYYGINLDTIEAEKRAMLAALREANAA